jgi:pyruvate kinase
VISESDNATLTINLHELSKKRRTKIVCTIGPATSSEVMLDRLVRAGADCLRLNFSHGAPTDHLKVIRAARKVCGRLGENVAILEDLPGPKFRVGTIAGGSIQIRRGDVITLSTRQEKAGVNVVPLRSKQLPHFVQKGGEIFLSDGQIKLRVLRTSVTDIICECEEGGRLYSGKGVNVPELRDGLRSFTDKDKEFLAFGLEHGVDLVAVSFVRSATDIEAVRRFMKSKGRTVPIVAKIEKREAVRNIDGIVDKTDALMVARGDLGVENPVEEVPELQKELIAKCNSRGIPVITATQMLESMVSSPTPTRAEVTDVANAIFDGTDAVMLSEETAVGKFPIECVRTLNSVSLLAEKRLISTREPMMSLHQKENLGDAVSEAVSAISTMVGAQAVLTQAEPLSFVSGMSRLRTGTPIIAFSSEETALRRASIVWGVYPHLVAKGSKNPSDMVRLFRSGTSKQETVVFVSRTLDSYVIQILESGKSFPARS